MEHNFCVRFSILYDVGEFPINSRWPQLFHVSSAISHLNLVDHDLLFFTFHPIVTSKILGISTVSWHHLEVHWPFAGVCPCWSRSSGTVITPRWCSPSGQTPMFPYGLWVYHVCCFLFWHIFVTTFGLSFLFSWFMSPSWGIQKDLTVLCGQESCSRAAQILRNPHTATAIILQHLCLGTWSF